MFPTNAKLTGMVQAFVPDKRYIASSLFTKATSDSNLYEFDQILWNRGIVPFRNENSVAGATAMTGKKRIQAKLHTLTEMKAVDERLLRWVDAPGKDMSERFNDLLQRELMDLADIFDRTFEKHCWDLLRTGTVTPVVEGISEAYAFGLGGSATVGTVWSTIASSTPIADLKGAKDAVRQKWGAEATEVFMGSTALKYLMQSAEALAILGEVTKDQYAVMGILEKISGLKITIVDGGYYDGATWKPYLSDNATNVNMAVIKADGPVGLFVETHPIDPKAPDGMYGRFAKVYDSDNPAGRFIQMTQTALPGLTMSNKVYTLKLWS